MEVRSVARSNVRIIRRSYTSGSKSVTHVGPDRLTVVTGLPPCEGATQEEEVTRRKRELERRQRDIATWGSGAPSDASSWVPVAERGWRR